MHNRPQAHVSDPPYTWQSSPSAEQTLSTTPVSIRGAQSRVCPGCGEVVGPEAKLCEACGEELVQTPKLIRCTHCAAQASSLLTVCPGCGRELRAATPPLVTVGAPALAACVLLLLFSVAWIQLRPLNWARNHLVHGVTLVEGLGNQLEPEVVIVMTPIVTTPAAETVPNAEPAAVALAAAPSEPAAAVPAEAAAKVADTAAPPSPTESSPVGVGGPSPEHTEAATPLPTDTPAPTDTAAPLPTDTAAPAEPAAVEPATPTWTPVPATETPVLLVLMPTATPVGEQSSSLPEGGIAQAAGMAAQTASEAATAVPLLSPTATPTPSPLPSLPPPTPTPVVHQVRTGDTLVSIAVKYNVTVEALMAANNISGQGVYTLQPGQMLVVPVPTPEPTATAVPPTAPAPTASAIRLEAPVLVEPAAGALVECVGGKVIGWQRVQFIKDSDLYRLHLGFVSGPPNGDQETITWVLSQLSPVTETTWEMDPSLCDLAPGDFNQEWRWWVEVVDGAGTQVSVSPPSEVRGFRWD